MIIENRMNGFRKPLYLVVGDYEGDTSPYARSDRLGSRRSSFDPELLPSLPAIWYALHLPATQSEVIEQSIFSVLDLLGGDLRHLIFPISKSMLQESFFIDPLLHIFEPVLIIHDKNSSSISKEISEKYNFLLEPIGFNDINNQKLQEHWETLSRVWIKEFHPGTPINTPFPELRNFNNISGSTIALEKLKTLAGFKYIKPQKNKHYEARMVLESRKNISKTILNYVNSEDGRSLGEFEKNILISQAKKIVNPPLTLAIKGVSPRYQKFVDNIHSSLGHQFDVSNRGNSESSLESDPPEVMPLIMEHKTAGGLSVGLDLGEVPASAFEVMHNLENYWINHKRLFPEPRKVKRYLKNLSKSVENIWDSETVRIIQSSSSIEVLSNFPIGLAALPGMDVPLAAIKPIVYRPMNPLTRALQYEYLPYEPAVLSKKLKVLLLECIPSTDHVGKISRNIWRLISDLQSNLYPSQEFIIREVENVIEFREEIRRNNPDILIISAHGIYDQQGNTAGICIGDTRTLGDDLGIMPPVVIMSACHTGPRGAGSVSVADMMLRNGAKAVISTLIPVHVVKNAMFMNRLFTYINESIRGTESYTTLEGVWHMVQNTNTVLDIIQYHPKLNEWGFKENKGITPIDAFMRDTFNVPLRASHLYEDSEKRLLKIAEMQGLESEIGGFLSSQGYVPESLMYTLIGVSGSVVIDPLS